MLEELNKDLERIENVLNQVEQEMEKKEVVRVSTTLCLRCGRHELVTYHEDDSPLTTDVMGMVKCPDRCQHSNHYQEQRGGDCEIRALSTIKRYIEMKKAHADE